MNVKSILLSVCVAAGLSASAQVRLEPFYPYSNYSLMISVGNSHMYGDLQHSISEPVYKLNFERNFTTYTSVGIDIQHGALASEEYKNRWTNGMSMYNQYTSAALYGRVSLGQFFKYPKNYFWKTMFGLYGGVGIGAMSNNITNITYKFKNHDNYEIRDLNATYIKPKQISAYMPYNLGFNFHLTKSCMFNINYQFCYSFSDYIDGYNFTSPPANNYYNDMYTVLSFGLSFYIGKLYDVYYNENGIAEKVRHFAE